MAQFEFKLPDIGEGVTEGEIVEWHVKPGQKVAEDEPMVEVMTDKATVTIGAPKDGVIRELRYAVGTIAQVGTVLVVIETGAVADVPRSAVEADAPARAAAPGPSARARDEGPAATAVGDIREGLPGAGYFTTARSGKNGHNGSADRESPGGHFAPQPLATPATRKLARDMNVDLRHVPPSGRGGRVTKEDVIGFASGGPSGTASGGATTGGLATVPIASAGAPARTRASLDEDDRALEVRRPFVGLRRRIAERMQAAKNTAAHFTFVEECDCTELVSMRERLKPSTEAAGVRLSYSAVHREGGRRRAEEAPRPQQRARRGDERARAAALLSRRASPPRPTPAWSFRS